MHLHDFKYCVWLTTDSDCIWSSYTNDFKPHLTIKSHLSYDQAFSLQNDISSCLHGPLQICLDGDIINSKSPDFHALSFRAKLGDSVTLPHWWPEDAHVSFYYGYEDISESVTEDLVRTIQTKKAMFDKIEVKLCSGHFRGW